MFEVTEWTPHLWRSVSRQTGLMEAERSVLRKDENTHSSKVVGSNLV